MICYGKTRDICTRKWLIEKNKANTDAEAQYVMGKLTETMPQFIEEECGPRR